MDIPPLSLSVLSLTPVSLHAAEDDDINGTSSPSFIPVPTLASPYPPLPPYFALSPSPNYPPPYPSLSLGESLSTQLRLTNTSTSSLPVAGVKMMLEVQSPTGRYRLNEVIHGSENGRAEGSKSDDQENGELESLPQLEIGQGVEMKAGMDIKELGQHVMICSVAWETAGGRRTFQRFFKFNVTPPLAIKTRIHIPSHPNASLSPARRERIFLEVLVQNTSLSAMVLGEVDLETVQGLLVHSRPNCSQGTITGYEDEEKSEKEKSKAKLEVAEERSLIPGDTRQFLFVLVPDHKKDNLVPTSTFLPVFPGGTILPLGRMDISWVSGQHREPGRLQTSTLNRRVPVSIPPTSGTPPPFSRPMSNAAGINGSPLVPARRVSAIPPSPGQFPSPRLGRALAPSPLPAPPPLLPPKSDLKWEYDLVVLDAPHSQRIAEVESRLSLVLRIAVRSPPIDGLTNDDDDKIRPLPPTAPILGVQYLSPILPQHSNLSAPLMTPQPTPLLAFSPPSRGSTPMSSAPSGGPSTVLSPPISSRPMTPVSSQLRQATTSHIGSSSTLQLTATNSPRLAQLQQQQQQAAMSSAQLPQYPPSPIADVFPPLPVCRSPLPHLKRINDPASIPGLIMHLGQSLVIVPPLELGLVVEDQGTTYVEPSERIRRWEATSEVKLDFMALDEGLAEVGGVRIIQFFDHNRNSGLIAREWDSLGDVWVSD